MRLQPETRRFRNLFRLFLKGGKYPFLDQWLFIQASFLLLLLRIVLRFIPFPILYALLRFFLKTPLYSHKQHLAYTNSVVAAVEKSGRYLLRTKCLAQALAVYILLNKKKIASDVQIGFIWNKDKLSGHAWLVADDRVLTGENRGIPLYFTLPSG